MYDNPKNRSNSLIRAVQRCNWRRVRRLIASGADVNASDAEGRTVLMYAAEKGRVGIVRLLLTHGANSSVVTSYTQIGWASALSVAANRGHLNVIRVLLTRKRRPAHLDMVWNYPSRWENLVKGWPRKALRILPNRNGKRRVVLRKYGQREEDALPFLRFVAFVLAAREKRPAAVAMLRPYRDYGFRDRKIASNWFVSAVEGDHVEEVKFWLDLGVEIDTPRSTHQRETALIVAADDGNIPIVELLLSHGADINAKTDYGFTALMGAAQQGKFAMVRLLLSLGADVHAKTDYDFSVFDWLKPPDESFSWRNPTLYEHLLSLQPAREEIHRILHEHIASSQIVKEE